MLRSNRHDKRSEGHWGHHTDRLGLLPTCYTECPHYSCKCNNFVTLFRYAALSALQVTARTHPLTGCTTHRTPPEKRLNRDFSATTSCTLNPNPCSLSARTLYRVANKSPVPFRGGGYVNIHVAMLPKNLLIEIFHHCMGMFNRDNEKGSVVDVTCNTDTLSMLQICYVCLKRGYYKCLFQGPREKNYYYRGNGKRGIPWDCMGVDKKGGVWYTLPRR